MLPAQIRWVCYLLGWMASKGLKFSKKEAEEFKLAFPEIPVKLVDLSVEEEKK